MIFVGVIIYRETFSIAIMFWDGRVNCTASGFVIAVPATVREQTIGATDDKTLQVSTMHRNQRQQVSRDRRHMEELEARYPWRKAGQDKFGAIVVGAKSFSVEVD